jgi:hypothetical protein
MPTPTSTITCSARRSPTAPPSAAPWKKACWTDRVVQIGLRAQGYTADDFNWSRNQGFRVVQAEECWHKSLAPLMAEVREKVGGGPVYLSSTSTASTRPGRQAPAPGNRRSDHHSGNRDRPWLPGPRPDRLRSGRSLAAYDTTGNTRCWPPTCCTKCSAYCLAWSTAEDG